MKDFSEILGRYYKDMSDEERAELCSALGQVIVHNMLRDTENRSAELPEASNEEIRWFKRSCSFMMELSQDCGYINKEFFVALGGLIIDKPKEEMNQYRVYASKPVVTVWQGIPFISNQSVEIEHGVVSAFIGFGKNTVFIKSIGSLSESEFDEFEDIDTVTLNYNYSDGKAYIDAVDYRELCKYTEFTFDGIWLFQYNEEHKLFVGSKVNG